MQRRAFIEVLATLLGSRAAYGQNAVGKRLIGVLMGATNDAEAATRKLQFRGIRGGSDARPHFSPWHLHVVLRLGWR